MNILCRLGFHRWKYKRKITGDVMIDLYSYNMTRYCERCERIEKTESIISAWLPPNWKIIKK